MRRVCPPASLHRRWPLVVKPNLEPLEERYAPGKTVELFEPSFFLPALLKNQHSPTNRLQLVKPQAESTRKDEPQSKEQRPWYAASLLLPMQLAGFHGIGTRDGTYFRAQLSDQQQDLSPSLL